jgi:hypothetical protein
MSDKMRDQVLDEILRKIPTLIVRATQDEYRVFRPDEEGKGSLWIARQRAGYRVVTTGTTHTIDRDIERITGKKSREMSDRAHKWWKGLSEEEVEQVFHVLAK